VRAASIVLFDIETERCNCAVVERESSRCCADQKEVVQLKNSSKILLGLFVVAAIAMVSIYGSAFNIIFFSQGVILTFKNESTSRIKEGNVAINERAYKIDSLAPGKSQEIHAEVDGDGSYDVRLGMESGKQFNEKLGYVTSGKSFNDVITIKDDGLLFNGIAVKAQNETKSKTR
jgi:hypothetical protein